MSRAHLTARDLELIPRMREVGLTHAQIAHVIGCSTSRITQVLNNYQPYRTAAGHWSVKKGGE